MRVFTRRAFGFVNTGAGITPGGLANAKAGTLNNMLIRTKANEFGTLPDSVSKDPKFIAGVAKGEIEIVSKKVHQVPKSYTEIDGGKEKDLINEIETSIANSKDEEETFVCKVKGCGKAFTKPQFLASHMKVHKHK